MRLSLGGRLSRGRRRTVLLLGVGAWMTGLLLVAYATGLLNSQELQSVDARFSIRGSRPAPKDVVLVLVDDNTFNDLGVQWPFPRHLHAQIVDRLVAAHAKAIGYDVQFTEKTSEDTLLLESIYGATSAGVPVVLDTTQTGAHGETGILGGNQVLAGIHAAPSSANFKPDSDQVIRRVAAAAGGQPTFAVALAAAADRHPIKPSLFGGQEAWIDYYGPAGTFPSVSFSSVLRGRVPAAFFRGKVVLIGASQTALQDLHATSAGPLMPGVEIQATAMQTVRRGLPLRHQPPWADVALIVLLGLAAPLASLRLAPLRALGLALALGAAYVVAGQLAFNAGVIVVFVYPMAALLLSASGSLGVQYATAASERERVRDLFSRFVPENVVGEVLARTEDGLRLGGVQRVCTVMFTDLRGFTSFAESLPPDRVIAVLNQYLSSMSDAILDHGGTLVAYMGDGIMAVFGAPIEAEDHADQALATAREMLDERLPRFNAWLQGEGLGEGFRMGIGLNSGPVMSGNVGSERRVEYAAIGDTTNTASRVEGMTKGTPHMLFFTEATRTLLREEPADVIFVAEFEVRGRQAQVKIWSLAGGGTEAPPPSAAVSGGEPQPESV